MSHKRTLIAAAAVLVTLQRQTPAEFVFGGRPVGDLAEVVTRSEMELRLRQVFGGFVKTVRAQGLPAHYRGQVVTRAWMNEVEKFTGMDKNLEWLWI